MKKAPVLVVFALASIFILIAACDNTPTGSPNIALYDVTTVKTAVNPGDTINFGTATVYPFAPQTRNFSVENTGTAALALTGSGDQVVIAGVDPSYFTIPTQPPRSVPAGGSVTFDIVFTAAGTGSQKNATFGIASDDPDLASVSVNVTGNDLNS